MLEKLISILQDKHDHFIGCQKDQITSAEAIGFKRGLAWAIESANSIIENQIAEEKYNEEQRELEIIQNCYQYDDSGNCDGFSR